MVPPMPTWTSATLALFFSMGAAGPRMPATFSPREGITCAKAPCFQHLHTQLTPHIPVAPGYSCLKAETKFSSRSALASACTRHTRTASTDVLPEQTRMPAEVV